MDYRPFYPLPLRLLSAMIDAGLMFGGLFITLLVFTNAVLRGTAGFDLAWSLEVTAFLLLWSTFLGCVAAIARGAHMRVTVIVETLLPVTAQRWLSLAIDLFIVAVLCSLIQKGISISALTWAQRTSVLYLPVGLLYASMPVGMACTLIFHLFNIYRDLRYPPAGIRKAETPGAAA